MNVITTVGRPCTPIPAIGNVFSTKAYISIISQQISESEQIHAHIRSLLPMFPVRVAYKIYSSTRRFCERKLREEHERKLIAYHEWLIRNL